MKGDIEQNTKLCSAHQNKIQIPGPAVVSVREQKKAPTNDKQAVHRQVKIVKLERTKKKKEKVCANSRRRTAAISY